MSDVDGGAAGASGDDGFGWRPIGHVRTAYADLSDTPIQARLNRDARGTVVVDPEFAAGLEGLDGFDYAWILSVLHLDRAEPAATDPLRPSPFLAADPSVRVGVFASRYPVRPNPIGLSLIRIEAIDGCEVTFSGVDLADGTPVLDLKPWVPQFDLPGAALVEAAGNVRIGWYATSRLTDPGDAAPSGEG
jgi:tRNA (adenine37-N6)-methyltransferase